MIPLHTIHDPVSEPTGMVNRWRHFISMPHHVLFALGALQAVLVVLWWLVDLGGRYSGWYQPFEWTVPSPWAHLYLMVYALFPLYMFGFLMTTYPKWMAGVPVATKHYLSAAIVLGVGLLMGYPGLVAGKSFFLFAVTIYLTGWGGGLYALFSVYRSAQRPDVLHARITSGVLLLGWVLLLIYAGGIYLDNASLIALARSGGIWWFLFPVFFAVSHRLIPFFSSVVLPGYEVIRPDWTLWLITTGAFAHGVLELAGKSEWLWIADLPMAAVALWLSFSWRLKQSLNVRILAMLHVAFAWLGVALILFGLQSLLLMMEVDLSLSRAPLHALVVGYFSSMLVAMSTRVTLGHSGRPLAADGMAWGIFLLIQATALIRVMADLPVINTYAAHLYLCSAFLWLVAFSGWLFKFMPIYWRVRNS